MSCFINIPSELDFLRTFPAIGGWASLIGQTNWKVRNSLPNFCKDIGLRQLDIFYVMKEQMSEATLKMLMCNKLKGSGRRYRGVYEQFVDEKAALKLKKSSPKNKKRINEIQKDIEKYVGQVFDNLASGESNLPLVVGAYAENQRTIVTANIGAVEEVRFYNGELNLLTDVQVEERLEAYNVVPIGLPQESIEKSPLLEETVKDLLGALRLDGLTRSQAILQVVEWNELDMDTAQKICEIPQHWFKIKDEYYYQFFYKEE